AIRGPIELTGGVTKIEAANLHISTSQVTGNGLLCIQAPSTTLSYFPSDPLANGPVSLDIGSGVSLLANGRLGIFGAPVYNYGMIGAIGQIFLVGVPDVVNNAGASFFSGGNINWGYAQVQNFGSIAAFNPATGPGSMQQ